MISGCRLCDSPRLSVLFSLGQQYISDFVQNGGHTPKAPLELVKCDNCGLVQLHHTFPRDSLYERYWYRSGISPAMRTALADLVLKTYSIARPLPSDLVVDIGCNDGTLLRSYPKIGLFRVGFEPARNLIEDARKDTEWIFNDFFSADLLTNKFPNRKAKIISCVAMFYDLEDPNSFVADVSKILAPDGIWVIQQNYLATMIQQNGFDNIGHEHLEYYSLTTLHELLKRHKLEIFDAETNDVNGGSIRTYVCHMGKYPKAQSVNEIKAAENRLALGDLQTYTGFASNISKLSSSLHQFIDQEVSKGRRVYAYGASNRGNTILQYCGLNYELIQKAADANPDKWGLRTAGTLIPIISKQQARLERPDYFLILPHHFLDEITKEEADYLRSGGKFIVPLPRFRIVSK